MKLANPAKKALRDRSVWTVTIWDESHGRAVIAHEFTTLAIYAEVKQIVADWLEPIQSVKGYTDAEMARWYSFVAEPKYKRTN